MKLLIVLCLVVVACAQNGKHTPYGKVTELTYIQQGKSKLITEYCFKETGADSSTIEAFGNGQWKNDETMNKFFYCYFLKAGVKTEDGKMDMKTILAKILL